MAEEIDRRVKNIGGYHG